MCSTLAVSKDLVLWYRLVSAFSNTGPATFEPLSVPRPELEEKSPEAQGQRQARVAEVARVEDPLSQIQFNLHLYVTNV